MNTLKIYAREDLGMRKGKMAAQASHAATAQLLNAMENQGDVRLLPAKAFQVLEAIIDDHSVSIHPVANEQTLRDILASSVEPYTIITDRGLTEFGGVPTVTTAAQGVFTPSDRKAQPGSGADLIARQWYVFSKRNPLPKYHAARMAAIGGLAMMHSLITPPVSPQSSAVLSLHDAALHGWLIAGFGKIGMGIKTDDALDALGAELQKAGIKTVSLEMDGNRLLVIGPQFPETVAPIMGRDSDLYQSGMLTLL